MARDDHHPELPRDNEDTKKYTCPICGGSGTISTGHGKNKIESTCTRCGGEGNV